MIERADIEKLAELSRLALSEEEVARFQGEIEAILSYVGEIASIDVPLGQEAEDERFNVMREDGNSHESGIFTDALLALAPNREGNYIKVKRILG